MKISDMRLGSFSIQLDTMYWSMYWTIIIPMTEIITVIPNSVTATDDTWSPDDVWNYDVLSQRGPKKWNSLWPGCSSSRQSPIDIDTHHVAYSSYLTTLEMLGYESIPPNTHWELANVGHAVHLELESDYRLTDGGLPGEFQAVYLTFHWGPTNITGSEHTINGQTFAMEMQLVHYNLAYKSYEAATSQEDGIAILSFLVETQPYGNPSFSQILNHLTNITEEGSSISLRPLSLLSLFPVNMNNYYRYEGSLTTPPCLPVVHWTIFSEPAIISEKQLEQFRAFRSTSSSNKHAKSRYISRVPPFQSRGTVRRHSVGQCRPIQSLGGRTVYTSDTNYGTVFTSNTGSTISVILAFTLGFIIIILTITRPVKIDEPILNHED